MLLATLVPSAQPALSRMVSVKAISGRCRDTALDRPLAVPMAGLIPAHAHGSFTAPCPPPPLPGTSPPSATRKLAPSRLAPVRARARTPARVDKPENGQKADGVLYLPRYVHPTCLFWRTPDRPSTSTPHTPAYPWQHDHERRPGRCARSLPKVPDTPIYMLAHARVGQEAF